jgi:hypothetical protein
MNFTNGEILHRRLRLIACAIGSGGPLIAGSKSLRSADPKPAGAGDQPEQYP